MVNSNAHHDPLEEDDPHFLKVRHVHILVWVFRPFSLSLYIAFPRLQFLIEKKLKRKKKKVAGKRMKNQVLSSVFQFIFVYFLLLICLGIEAQTCDPNGSIQGTTPPPGQCNQENNASVV